MKDLVDLFGQPFKLNYNGKYLFKTSLSALLSALLMITIAVYAFWNIYDMSTHSGLNMNNYQTMLSKNEVYAFNNTNFFLAFDLRSIGYGYIFEEGSNYSKYFEFKSYYYGKNHSVLNLTRCNTTENNLTKGLGFFGMCLDFNNSRLGGNYFSYGRYRLC